MEERTKKVTSLFNSRRFWLSVTSVVLVSAKEFGLELDPESVNTIVIAIGAWVIGDSFRTTE